MEIENINWNYPTTIWFGINRIKDIQKVGESKLTDEAWEQLIWGICQKDPFLKVKGYKCS